MKCLIQQKAAFEQVLGPNSYLQLPRLPDILAHHVVPDVVDNPQLRLHAAGAIARLPKCTTKPICIFGIKFTELFRAAVRFGSSNGEGPIQLALNGIVVELELVYHGEDVTPQVSEALAQQEESIGHSGQLEVFFCI